MENVEIVESLSALREAEKMVKGAVQVLNNERALSKNTNIKKAIKILVATYMAIEHERNLLET